MTKIDQSRIEFLYKKLNAEEKEKIHRTKDIYWKDETKPFPIIKVDVNFLRYRLENGRTRKAQLEYLAKHKDEDPELFLDPESEKAQKIQHGILLEMINKEGLADDVEARGLKDPLIITCDGYVVNGNRRLASIREKTNTEYVDCCVLPDDATPQDYYRLELNLQMARDFKADYDWVDELLNIRYGQISLGETEQSLSKKLNMEESEVKSKINMLILVDAYLQWDGKVGQYWLVDKSEQAFITLEKSMRKIKKEEDRKLAQNIIFSMIKNPPKEGRLYNHIVNYFAHSEDFVSQLTPKVDCTPEIETFNNPTSDPLAEISEVVEIKPEKRAVSEAFGSSRKAAALSQTLYEVSDDVEWKSKEKKNKNAAYSSINEALRKIQAIIIDENTANIEGIKNKLSEIQSSVKKIQKKIEEIEK